jgi:hypothetical protein
MRRRAELKSQKKIASTVSEMNVANLLKKNLVNNNDIDEEE